MGRTNLLGLIDRATDLAERDITDTPPVIVLEGCGGSGRTELLNQVHRKWHRTASTVLVDPLEFRGSDRSEIRPVLAAAMLGLSDPEYRLSFPRVVLAHIAMEEDYTGVLPKEAVARLDARIDEYRGRPALVNFLAGLVRLAGSLAANIKDINVDVNELATLIAARLPGRASWPDPALSWFAHQGRGFEHNPKETLYRLSQQARSDVPGIRRSVDDLLVAALLADIRYRMAEIRNRPANALVLLDSGDAPAAVAFTNALIRVRQAIASIPGNPESALPDALTVVTTSSGPVADTLATQFPPSMRWDESQLTGKTRAYGTWLRISSADLDQRAVHLLTESRALPADIDPEVVTHQVFRLTGGHPKTTELVLDRIAANPLLVDDMDTLLTGPGPEGGTMEEDLLRLFVRALTPTRRDNDTLRAALVMLSATRDRTEAKALLELLPETVKSDSPVLTSPTLWNRDRLHPLVRYLGLRVLSTRPDDWNRVIGALAATTDPGRRLHHQRMLGQRGRVATELARSLSAEPSGKWLELFDEVVATADPRERDVETIRAAGQPATVEGHVYRLLGVIPAYEHNPCLNDLAARQDLCAHARHSFRWLADSGVPSDTLPFIRRADRYDR